MKDLLSKDIKCLSIDKKVTDKLKENNVETVLNLCSLNRKVLKSYGFASSEINQIIVKLQLSGLDLGKKYR